MGQWITLLYRACTGEVAAQHVHKKLLGAALETPPGSDSGTVDSCGCHWGRWEGSEEPDFFFNCLPHVLLLIYSDSFSNYYI